jgi:hypothetical protein
MLRGGSASRGDARLHDCSAIAMGDRGKCARDGRMAAQPQWEQWRLLEEFVCLPEFILVSTIVSIGSVRPNRCLGVALFYYFRFLFVTRENYGVERQGNLLTEILLLHVFNASMTVCQYASTPVRQYASTPVRQYASMTVCQYASTPI